MNLEKLFDTYVKVLSEYKRLKKEHKARNKRTVTDTSQVLSLADAQGLIDKKLENEKKDKYFANAERMYEASSDELMEALLLVKHRVQIPYGDENYIVYMRKGDVKMEKVKE